MLETNTIMGIRLKLMAIINIIIIYTKLGGRFNRLKG